MRLDSKIPDGPIEKKWERHKFNLNLVSPTNKKRYTILVVGTGLAEASAAASLSELGYKVIAFCIQDSPRMGHSIAAQGGINAAKNYSNDGDSVWRLFYDTVKGGDYRSREANVYRLAELSNKIIDHAVAQGIPFSREYSGYLHNRSFGGALVSRTFYVRGQTGQQLLLGAYGQPSREIKRGGVVLLTRREMLDLVLIEGKARGIIVRNLVNGNIESYAGDAVVLATGGYGNVYYLSTNAKASNCSAIWRAYKKGDAFANPAFVQIHPTCIPVHGEYQSKLTLMSESIGNDGRVWVPRNQDDKRDPNDIPEEDRDYYLERRYARFGNLVPLDVASRAAKQICDEGRGVGSTGLAVYLDFADAINREGRKTIEERYGNLFEMYEQITGVDPYREPMMIYPAVHYTMGGLWVDYDLMSSIPGLYIIGEANFSDHGANRLGASALMQALADGYFILPNTIGDYLVEIVPGAARIEHSSFKEAEKYSARRISDLLSLNGKKTVEEFHRELGKIMWDKVGISRNKEGLKKALEEIPLLRERFWKEARVVGSGDCLNSILEKANRMADFLKLGELMALDALKRDESCGCHFREEHQTLDGKARRDDSRYAHVSIWDYNGPAKTASLYKEKISFEYIKSEQRSYK